MEDYDRVRRDFNEIADLPSPPAWNHNNCYFPYLLRRAPASPDVCLEIGCGQGELCGLLAPRAGRVIGVDLAENMIAQARRLHPAPNVEYRCGNILEMEFADGSFDLIVTTATAHHLPFEWLLAFAKRTLKPRGVLLILDLVREETLSDRLLWSFAVLPNLVMQLARNGSVREDPHSAAVWKRHGEYDRYLTLREVRRAADEQLPGAELRRKLFWRYALIWEKPERPLRESRSE